MLIFLQIAFYSSFFKLYNLDNGEKQPSKSADLEGCSDLWGLIQSRGFMVGKCLEASSYCIIFDHIALFAI